jgi:hypothetical protein
VRRDKGELRNSVHQIPSNADCPDRDWPSVSRLDGREKIDDVAWRARANVFSWPVPPREGLKAEHGSSARHLGLIRKQFLYNDKGVGGGVYLWETREAAEACYYKSPWGESVRRACGGNEPDIAWFETGVVVDNQSHQIKTAT